MSLAFSYRFFYIWIREGGRWEIVVSHDAVSRDPLGSLHATRR
jgi:hypothetical protein